MSAMTHNILFAGVGGQGVLLAAEITALAAVHSGYDVKQTEVHGVSQRGGSVETHVRFGDKVWSPIVTPGKTDVVVGLEKLEALRFAHYAQPATGVILVNDHEIIPASVKDADAIYPHDAIERLRQIGCVVLPMEASRAARDLGDGRMANVVMLGAMASFLPITEEVWIETLKRRLPEKYREPNLKAFTEGHALASLMEDRPSVRA
ncbi:MAG: indolepyruvate oxidoreductase subunit beta [Anaerolineales bacterium]